MSEENNAWRKCSTCKKPILLGAIYYECSVSSCSRKSAPVQFCSVDCWDAHSDVYNHRSAAAVEERAPMQKEPEPVPTPTTPAVTASTTEAKAAPTSVLKEGNIETDTLVVVSKIKKYVQDRAGLNTAADVLPAPHFRRNGGMG